MFVLCDETFHLIIVSPLPIPSLQKLLTPERHRSTLGSEIKETSKSSALIGREQNLDPQNLHWSKSKVWTKMTSLSVKISRSLLNKILSSFSNLISSPISSVKVRSANWGVFWIPSFLDLDPNVNPPKVRAFPTIYLLRAPNKVDKGVAHIKGLSHLPLLVPSIDISGCNSVKSGGSTSLSQHDPQQFHD